MDPIARCLEFWPDFAFTVTVASAEDVADRKIVGEACVIRADATIDGRPCAFRVTAGIDDVEEAKVQIARYYLDRHPNGRWRGRTG